MKVIIVLHDNGTKVGGAFYTQNLDEVKKAYENLKGGPLDKPSKVCLVEIDWNEDIVLQHSASKSLPMLETEQIGTVPTSDLA